MPPTRLIVIIGVILTLSITVSLMQAQQLMPLPQPGAPRATTELLTGGGFETDTDSDKIPDGWTAKNTEVTSIDKQKCNKPGKPVARTGTCAFQFKGNVDGTGSTIEQTIADTSALVDGVTLTFSAYLDPRSSIYDTGFGKALVNFSDGTRLKLALLIPGDDDRAPADYVLVEDIATLIISPGASISSAKVKFGYNRTTGKFLIDDVRFAAAAPDYTPTSTASNTLVATEPPALTSTPILTPTVTLTETLTPTFTLSPTSTSTPLPLPTQLFATDGAAFDNFGYSAAYSRSADTVLIGARAANDGQGSAYVFVRSGNVWVQQAQLIANDGAADDLFGISVALSADGDTALVGAWLDDVSAKPDQGSAYVFTRSGTVWTQQAKLTASDGEAGDEFGVSVALSADGSTALVGAYLDAVGANTNQGAAYAFTRSGTSWTQQAKLTASDGGSGDFFGISVALSADGGSALVGALGDEVGANTNQGSAYAFTRSGTVWTQQAQLTASDGADSDSFGYAVALSANGDTALVSTINDIVGANTNQGSAYAFTRSGTSWVQQAKLTASDGMSGDNFGVSVALSADGDTALVGAYFDDVGVNSDQGSAYPFTRSGTSWTQQALITASNGAAFDTFGASVALSGDGLVALVGAYGDNNNRGSAYIIALP